VEGADTRTGWRGRLGAALAAGLVAAWAPGAAPAQALTSIPEAPGDGPLVVKVGFDLRHINAIDDEAETFEFDAVLTLEWRDARQAFDPGAVGASEKLYQGDYQFDEVFTGWFPQVVLVNGSGLYETRGVLLRVRPDGSLRLVEALTATARTRLDLVAYPFDSQRLEAEFEVLGFGTSEVALEAIPPTPPSQIRLPQWHFTGLDTAVRTRPASRAGARGEASTYVASVSMDRDPLFVIRLVVLPLTLIVMLSWVVFWMDQSSVGDRVSVSFIGILTVVAYQIVLIELLPSISYMTWINGFLNMSFAIVGASVVVNLWVSRLDRRGLTERGNLIDQRCRWIFPATYFGLLTVVAMVARVVVR
jgi:hypothetical protein